MSKTIDLDLDSIVSPKRTIKINDKTVNVELPSVQGLLTLMQTLFVLQGDPTEENIQSFRNAMSAVFPALKDEELSINQLVALFQYLQSETVPAEAKEVQELGISGSGEDTEKKTE